MNTSYRGYVYLIGSTNFGWYKIGMSRNAVIRIHQLGILLPFKVEVIAVWKTSNPSLLESLMHEKYRDYHLNGEWFLFDKANILKIIEDSIPFDGVRIYPSAKKENSDNYSFRNVDSDKTKAAWKIKPRFSGYLNDSKSFMKYVRGYLEENGLPETKENLNLARKQVAKLFQ